MLTRRQSMQWLLATGMTPRLSLPRFHSYDDETRDPSWQPAIDKALEFLVGQQSRAGHWLDDSYPTAVTSLAGIALICSGSTTIQGPFAQQIRRTADYLISKCRKNGLIGDPKRDSRYTYGHGFAMLFLSQVFGEEEDVERREELAEILDRAVEFSCSAQTRSGGWGYVSAQEDEFDEGSTTVTQVQGLRACRNAGIVVPKKTIVDAIAYIYNCKNNDGGISYSSSSRGSSRPPITAAALAALFNAGEYNSEQAGQMWGYSRQHLHQLTEHSGHWHYAYLYYTQVVYRQGPDEWIPYRNRLYSMLVKQQLQNGSWGDSFSPVYSTACSLIMLQLDKGFLPIFQR